MSETSRKFYALLVGANTYIGDPSPLTRASEDVQILEKFLKERLPDHAEERILALRDSNLGQTQFYESLQTICAQATEPDDLVLLVFVGHSLRIDGEAYRLLPLSEPHDPEKRQSIPCDTMIASTLANCRANKLILLDTSYPPIPNNNAAGANATQPYDIDRCVVIASSPQEGRPVDDKGVLCQAVLEILQDGRVSRSGWIYTAGLIRQLQTKIPALCRSKNVAQELYTMPESIPEEDERNFPLFYVEKNINIGREREALNSWANIALARGLSRRDTDTGIAILTGQPAMKWIPSAQPLLKRRLEEAVYSHDATVQRNAVEAYQHDLNQFKKIYKQFFLVVFLLTGIFGAVLYGVYQHLQATHAINEGVRGMSPLFQDVPSKALRNSDPNFKEINGLGIAGVLEGSPEVVPEGQQRKFNPQAMITRGDAVRAFYHAISWTDITNTRDGDHLEPKLWQQATKSEYRVYIPQLVQLINYQIVTEMEVPNIEAFKPDNNLDTQDYCIWLLRLRGWERYITSAENKKRASSWFSDKQPTVGELAAVYLVDRGVIPQGDSIQKGACSRRKFAVWLYNATQDLPKIRSFFQWWEYVQDSANATPLPN